MRGSPLSLLFRLAAIAAGCVVVSGCGESRPAGAPFQTGITALRAGEFEHAIEYLSKASEANPKDGMLLAWLGVAYWQANQPDQAVASFENAAKFLVSSPEPLEFVGHIYSRQKRWSAADGALVRALGRSPKNPRVLTAISVVRLGTNNIASAKSCLDEALRIDPRYAPALYNAAWLNWKWLKKKDPARLQFQQYLTLADDTDRAAGVRRALAELDRTEKDRRSGEQAVTLGSNCYRRKDYKGALGHFRRAIECDDTYDTAYHNLGLAHMALGDNDSAVTAFAQELRIRPDKNDARYCMALAFWEKGDEADATTALKTLLQRAPDHANAHLLLGKIYSADKTKIELTRKHYSRYVELAPNGAEAGVVEKWLDSHHGSPARPAR